MPRSVSGGNGVAGLSGSGSSFARSARKRFWVNVRSWSCRSRRDQTVDFYWIRLHWFELSALFLLSLNLWFAVKVLSVLRAVQDGLILLARWLDIARNEIDRQPGGGSEATKD